MRTRWWLLPVALVLALHPASAGASAGVFPDLPGSKMLEESIADGGSGSSTTEGPGTVGDDPPDPDRAPAPQPGEGTPAQAPSPAQAVNDAASPDEIAIVTGMPGGGGLPLLNEADEAGAGQTSVVPLAALAALIVFTFTRFLYRLNELGRRRI